MHGACCSLLLPRLQPLPSASRRLLVAVVVATLIDDVAHAGNGRQQAGVARQGPGMCPEGAWKLPERCPGEARGVPRACPRGARDVPGRCPGGAREMPGRCPGGAREMPGSCPGNAREVPENCFSDAFRSSGGRRRANLKKAAIPRVAVQFFGQNGQITISFCQFS